MNPICHRPPQAALGQLGQNQARDESFRVATTMVLHGAAGALIGAAAGTKGKEGLWAAVGFASGTFFGEAGIVGVALAALWRKA